MIIRSLLVALTYLGFASTVSAWSIVEPVTCRYSPAVEGLARILFEDPIIQRELNAETQATWYLHDQRCPSKPREPETQLEKRVRENDEKNFNEHFLQQTDWKPLTSIVSNPETQLLVIGALYQLWEKERAKTSPQPNPRDKPAR